MLNITLENLSILSTSTKVKQQLARQINYSYFLSISLLWRHNSHVSCYNITKIPAEANFQKYSIMPLIVSSASHSSVAFYSPLIANLQ